MRPELELLAWSGALAFVQVLIAVVGHMLQVGLPALAGNRDGIKTDSTTLMGAQLFFWARVAYALAYLAGIPWLRTGVWFVSVIGLALIFFALL